MLSHAVDARHPAEPSIAAVDAALAAGADLRTDGPGDVDGPDGPLWCDGGPLHWLDPLEGAPVVPAANLAVGVGGTGIAYVTAATLIAVCSHGPMRRNPVAIR